MPFNRVNGTKIASFWLSALRTTEDGGVLVQERSETIGDNSTSHTTTSPLSSPPLRPSISTSNHRLTEGEPPSSSSSPSALDSSDHNTVSFSRRRSSSRISAFRKSGADMKVKVPPFIPGLMLIPIPEAGCIAGYVDIAFHAVILYVLGSLVYVIDSFYQSNHLLGLVYDSSSNSGINSYNNSTKTSTNNNDDSKPGSSSSSSSLSSGGGGGGGDDDSGGPTNPANFLNLLAALFFLLNALCCLLDWWLQRRLLSIVNISYNHEDDTETAALDLIPDRISLYYLLNNLFFMAAAVTYTIQGVIMMYPATNLVDDCGKGTFCFLFWYNFLGSTFYLGSAVFSVLETWENFKIRREEGLPPLKAISCNIQEIDWFAWGDFVMVGASILPFSQTFLLSFGDFPPPDMELLNMIGCFVFLLDSLLYLIGYLLFIYELRESLKAGILSREHAQIVVDCRNANSDDANANANSNASINLEGSSINYNQHNHHTDIQSDMKKYEYGYTTTTQNISSSSSSSSSLSSSSSSTLPPPPLPIPSSSSSSSTPPSFYSVSKVKRLIDKTSTHTHTNTNIHTNINTYIHTSNNNNNHNIINKPPALPPAVRSTASPQTIQTNHTMHTMPTMHTTDTQIEYQEFHL